MTVWQPVEPSIWIIEVCIIILKTDVFMADCDVVLNIRNDLQETMKECRDVTEKYCSGRSAYLRLGQLFVRLFAGLL